MAQPQQADSIRSNFPPNARIACDWECMKCGYNLRTLRIDACCLECGSDVAGSVTPRPDANGILAINAVWVSWIVAPGAFLLSLMHVLSWALFFAGTFGLAFRSSAARRASGDNLPRWMWWFAFAGLMGAVLAPWEGVIAGDLLPGFWSPTKQQYRLRRDWEPESGSTPILEAGCMDIGATIRISDDGTGQLLVTVVDDMAQTLASLTLLRGGSGTAKDRHGNPLHISLDAAGKVTIRASNGAAMTFGQSGIVRAHRPDMFRDSRTAMFVLGTILVPAGQVAVFCYVLTARRLALCVRRRDLATWLAVCFGLLIVSFPPLAFAYLWLRWEDPIPPLQPTAFLASTAQGVGLVAGTAYLLAAAMVVVCSLTLAIDLQSARKRKLQVDIDPRQT